jgi:hypothetical protein
MCARKTSVQHHKKIQTNPLKRNAKKDAKKDLDPLENLAIKKRLHKAKRTLEDI